LKAKLLLVLTLAGLLAACSLPKMPSVHKVTVQQGNVITQDMVDRLKPGMTRSQVAFVMGEPVLRSPFTPNRWDYIYSIVVPGYFEQEVRMSLYFENEVLAYFTGDMAPTTAQDDIAADPEAAPAEDAASG
jgi:outer membrane protein assembly factor BamE